MADEQGWSTEDLINMCGFRPGPDDWLFEERDRRGREALERGEHFRESRAPAAFDLEAGGANYITPVTDQGGCGSCVAFGTIAAVEGTIRYRKKDPTLAVDFSEAHLFYCHAYQEGRNCGGALINPGFGWQPQRALIAFQQKGVVSDACFIYDVPKPPPKPWRPQPCKLCPDWAKSITYITGYQRLTSQIQMKEALLDNGPLIACLTVYEDFDKYPKTDPNFVYRHTSSALLGGHCVCIYGYDDVAKCWMGKNSWGFNWGDLGHFRIAYGECGIDSEMWAAYVD